MFDTTGTFIDILASPGCERGSHFGTSVAINGNLITVGAPGAGVSKGQVTFEGRAYLYSKQTNAPLLILASPNAAPYGNLGNSVAINGNTLIVGANGENAGGQFLAGRAYIFNLVTN